MRLEMKVGRAALKELVRRHQGDSKREKSLVLEELIGLTGCHRC